MSKELHARIQIYLNSPHPPNGNLIMELLNGYSENGFHSADPELIELIQMCAEETDAHATTLPEQERNQAQECANILRAIAEETAARGR